MAAEHHEKLVRKIQKRLSGPKLSVEGAVERFEQLPELRVHAHAYLDAILREKYQHQQFESFSVLLQFLRGLLHLSPEYTLHGCFVLHQADSHAGTSFHRQHSLALPFFVYELTGKLAGTPFKSRADQFWVEWFAPAVQAIVVGDTLQIESVARHETLYAPADDLKLDLQRRFAFTWSEPWTPTREEREAQWRLVPDTDAKAAFYIQSAKYPTEYLFASDTRHASCHRGGHHALMWCDGHLSGELQLQARWELHAFGRDVFALYNPLHRVYLLASGEMRDPQRRFALTARQDPAASAYHVSEDRKWRFRACIQ